MYSGEEVEHKLISQGAPPPPPARGRQACHAPISHRFGAREIASRAQTAPLALLWPLAVTGLAMSPPRAFLTREQGKNRELKALLESRGVATDELPCISFERKDRRL